MAYDRSLKAHAEVMLKILLLIIEKTPLGGARTDELIAAYCSVKGSEPHARTLRRIICDLNAFVQTWENEGETNWPISIPPDLQAKLKYDCPTPICSYRHNGERFFVFTRDLTSIHSRQVPPELATLALRVYPLRKSIGSRLYEHLLRRLKSDPALRLDRWQQFEENLERYVFVSGLSTRDTERIGAKLRQLFDAVCRNKRIRFTYQHGIQLNSPDIREIEPYGLLHRQSAWYVTGRDIAKGQLRLFRLDQIENIRLLENSTYSIPPEFSLSETFGEVWAAWVDDESETSNVVLRVHPLVSTKFVNNIYHPSQQEEHLPDGWLKVTFKVKGVHQMLPWLMSWGTMIEVLEPAKLREELAATARQIWQLYGQ